MSSHRLILSLSLFIVIIGVASPVNIQDPANVVTIRMNQNCNFAKNQIKLKKEVKKVLAVDAEEETEIVEIIVNFSKFIVDGDYPEKCKNIKKGTLKGFNYLITDQKTCVGGQIDFIPKIDITNFKRRKEVKLGLNSLTRQSFSIMLTSKYAHEQKTEIYFERILGRFNNRFDTLYLHMGEDGSQKIKDLEVINQSKLVIFIKNFSLISILVVSSFFFIFFSYIYHSQRIFYFQFGVIYNLLTQISFSFIDYWNLEDTLFAVVVIGMVFLPIIPAYLLSIKRSGLLVYIWVFYTLADYILASWLVTAVGTLYLSVFSIGILAFFAWLLSRFMKHYKSVEVYISFTISINLTNQYVNLSSFTTSFIRVKYLLNGFQLFESDPTRFYILVFALAAIFGFLRTFMTRYTPWNRKFVISRDQEILDLYNKVQGKGLNRSFMSTTDEVNDSGFGSCGDEYGDDDDMPRSTLLSIEEHVNQI